MSVYSTLGVKVTEFCYNLFMARFRLKMEPDQCRQNSTQKVVWAPEVQQNYSPHLRNGKAREKFKNKQKTRMKDAEMYIDQFRGVSLELREAYLSFLKPGIMFHTVVPVCITGAALKGTHDKFPTIKETWAFDPNILANTGAILLYTGVSDVIRKSNSIDGIMREMTAKLHTFILGNRQVIPSSILLVEPAVVVDIN